MNLDTPQGPVLYLSGVTVSFDGFRALDSLSLIVEPGELRCVIGPNGAGKTTLMDVITGRTRPDSGEVHFGEQHDLARLSEPEIARAGIGRKFQKPTIFKNHTVFENLELALETDKRVLPTLGASLTPAQEERIDGEATFSLTARSSGWRWGCCWCRIPGCSSSTSRSRA